MKSFKTYNQIVNAIKPYYNKDMEIKDFTKAIQGKIPDENLPTAIDWFHICEGRRERQEARESKKENMKSLDQMKKDFIATMEDLDEIFEDSVTLKEVKAIKTKKDFYIMLFNEAWDFPSILNIMNDNDIDDMYPRNNPDIWLPFLKTILGKPISEEYLETPT